jgi:ankyrin repeat protein
VQLLLDSGVDPCVKAENGDDALSIAIANQNEAVVNLLQSSN